MTNTFQRTVLTGHDTTVTVTVNGDDARISYSDSTADWCCGREAAEDQIRQLLACGYTVREGFASQITAERAAELGRRDGVAEVVDVLNEQGRDVVLATLRPGHLAWDEGARNNDCHKFSNVPEQHREAYYRAYEQAARAKAEEIRDEEGVV